MSTIYVNVLCLTAPIWRNPCYENHTQTGKHLKLTIWKCQLAQFRSLYTMAIKMWSRIFKKMPKYSLFSLSIRSWLKFLEKMLQLTGSMQQRKEDILNGSDVLQKDTSLAWVELLNKRDECSDYVMNLKMCCIVVNWGWHYSGLRLVYLLSLRGLSDYVVQQRLSCYNCYLPTLE